MADERIGLHSLKPAPGSRKPRKRVGRGEGSGYGQDLRPRPQGRRLALGREEKVNFEGGQTPIHMRMRKLRGPHMKKSMPFEKFRTQTQPVNLRDLEARFDKGAEVTPDSLREKNLATRREVPVKILGQGEHLEGAHRARPRLLEDGTREDRGRRRHLPADRGVAPVLRTFLNSFRVADIRKKLAFTAAMLALYRLGAYIPAPGINVDAVEDISEQLHRLERPRLPQPLLGRLPPALRDLRARDHALHHGVDHAAAADRRDPALDKLRKEGEVGQQKITQYTRYLTVALAFGQSIGYVFLFRTFSSGSADVVENFTFGRVFVIVMTLTAGCVLLMWLGELITQRGIGNGISLMIFACIASGIPNGIQAWWTNPDQIFEVMMPFLALAIIAAIVFMQEGQRRIPVQYAKRVVGRRMAGGGSTYLPLRVNMAGVIPVIFAASLMAFPPTVGELTQAGWAQDFSTFFNPNERALPDRRVVLIIVFTYFYTAVTFNPVEQADNLKKYGGFIPGVRPGRPTAEYLDRILARLTFPGALYLAAVAALPTILINQTSANFYFGGTSILIVVGVALER